MDDTGKNETQTHTEQHYHVACEHTHGLYEETKQHISITGDCYLEVHLIMSFTLPDVAV